MKKISLFKKAFTLIELIVVIVVLGILAAIVIPNISSFQKEAEVTAIGSNVRNLQTSVDMYSLDSIGQFPVAGEQPVEFIPKPIDFDLIHPDYTRNLPKTNSTKYWIDFKGKVWASTIDSPEEVNIQAGKVTWEKVDEALHYNVYEVEGYKGVIGAAYKSTELTFVEKVTTESYTGEAGVAYVVSAVDENGFESAPSGMGYDGYDSYIPNSEIPEEEPVVEAFQTKLWFDGTDDYVSTTKLGPTGGSQRTIEVKAKVPTLSENRYFLTYGSLPNAGESFRVGYGYQTAGITVDVSHGAITYEAINDGKEHHYAFVVPNKENPTLKDVEVYQDGIRLTKVLASTYPDNPIKTGSTNPITMGRLFGSGGYLKGELNEVRVWDTARTSEQINATLNKELSGKESGLTGLWKFNEGQGLVTGDRTSSENHGSLYGPIWYRALESEENKSAYFNGTNQSIQQGVSGASYVKDNFTFEFWANPELTHQIDAQSTSGTGGVSGQKYLITPDWGNSTFVAGVGVSVGINGLSIYEHATDYMPATLVYQASITQPTHVAVVYKDNTPSLYINGEFVKQGVKSPRSKFFNINMGGFVYGYYKGSADDFRLWNHARTANEIKENFNKELVGTENGLIAYWNFNELDSRFFNDKSMLNTPIKPNVSIERIPTIMP